MTQFWFAAATEEFTPPEMVEQAKAATAAGFDGIASSDHFAPVGDDPTEHVDRIREMEQLGASVVCLQLIGDADPIGSIRRYGETVLPTLRGVGTG